jgi:uncharacterized protein YndB with AHSA1/START domain
MSTKTITIAPVRKTITVAASQAHAFEVFTAGIDRWWPKKAHVGATPPTMIAIEPRVGGRWYERAADGEETDVGRILVWEPPQRFVMSWDIDCHWQPDRTVGTEVEVRFIAEAPDATRVELEHRAFERLGAEGGASLRKDVDGGWPGMLDLFKKAAEG